jgi:hypothetical protein
MHTSPRRLAQLAWLSILITSGVQADQTRIDCKTLGSHLDPALLTGRFSESATSTTTPAVSETTPTSLNFIPQIRHDVKIKLEPVLTEDELYACFGNQARELSWLRNSIDNQKRRFRSTEDANKLGLLWTQVAIIGFGALATILLAFGNSPRWSFVKSLAIIPTALVTAISTFSAFQDYRGEVTRTAKAESDLSKLITDIDIRLLQISGRTNQAPITVDLNEVHRWWERADGIIKGVDDDWLNHFAKSEAKQ